MAGKQLPMSSTCALWSESESGGSTSRLSKELHLFPRKWAAQAQLVCGQPVGRNAALPIPVA